jgi:UDP-N-acetylmuramoyl-L-alanyl-D-glutamate--2,6-diaminopimelate ligase
VTITSNKSSEIFTDNSKETNKNAIFVINSLNEKYLEDAKNSGFKKFIDSCELKDYFDFSAIKIIAITGTNGKTTTAAMVYSILLDLGYKTALQGTRGFFINDKQVENYSLTTPMQLDQFQHIQMALEQNCQYFVMEASSHAIFQKRIEGLEFALKILTNITQDHLDFHKTLEEYTRVKNSFFEDDTPKLINKDEPKAKYNIKNGFGYGLDSPATYKIQAYSFKNGTNAVFSYFDKMHSFTIATFGLFNVYNAMAAIAAAHIATKRELDEICEAIENFGGVSGRMEIVSDEPLVVVDFAHTPDGMVKVLESFKDKKIITVFGAGGNRDALKRPIMGKVAELYSDQIIITSDNPRFEDPDKIIEDIVSGITNKDKIIIEINRKEAIRKALNLTNQQSVVLILGKGDEEYQIIYDKKFPFSDKKIVQELLGK